MQHHNCSWTQYVKRLMLVKHPSGTISQTLKMLELEMMDDQTMCATAPSSVTAQKYCNSRCMQSDCHICFSTVKLVIRCHKLLLHFDYWGMYNSSRYTETLPHNAIDGVDCMSERTAQASNGKHASTTLSYHILIVSRMHCSSSKQFLKHFSVNTTCPHLDVVHISTAQAFDGTVCNVLSQRVIS